MESSWAHFFKPEVRKQGGDLVAEGDFVLSQKTDTQIEGFLRASKPARVRFASDSIASRDFTVVCNCPPFVKGQLCKHIWATLVLLEREYPDFLANKNDIHKKSVETVTASIVKPKSESQIQYEANAKVKQSEYRKAQYQQQKARVKGEKLAKKSGGSMKSAAVPELPEDIAEAYSYFAANGFPEGGGSLDAETLRNAKKQLSRIFHPDKGGTHEEILELNRNFEILLEHILAEA